MGSFGRIHRYHVISYFQPLNWIALTEFFQNIICETQENLLLTLLFLAMLTS